MLAAVFLLAGCGREAVPGASPTGNLAYERRPTEWFLRSISEDGRGIELVYTISGVASGCQREGSVSVEGTEEKVTVIAYKSVLRDGARACTQELAYIEETVTLERPLGEKALVGCRPGRLDASEDGVCRDLERSRNAGIIDFPPES